MTKPISDAMRSVGERMVNAQETFIENIMRLGECSRADAEKVLRVYRSLKMIRYDAGVGRINVKHGAYFDKTTIQNAISYEESKP